MAMSQWEESCNQGLPGCRKIGQPALEEEGRRSGKVLEEVILELAGELSWKCSRTSGVRLGGALSFGSCG